MEKIQRLIAAKEAFPQMDRETFNFFLNSIKSKNLVENIDRITRGLKTEELYKTIYQDYPWVKEITGLKQEQTAAQKEKFQIPDYKLLVEDNNRQTFSIFVDVKNIEGDKTKCELMKKQVVGLKKYASNNNTIIIIAIYWKKYNIWTHDCLDSFTSKKKHYVISMEDAYCNDVSCILGDINFFIGNKFYRKSYYEKNDNTKVARHEKYGEIKKSFLSLNNKDYSEIEIIDNAVIDSMFKMNQIELQGTPENRIQIEECDCLMMCKLSTWLIRLLNTMGIEEYSEEVNSHTYARYALLFIEKFIKSLNFKRSYVIPRKMTATTDKLYKMAFYKSNVYYSYLIAKGKACSVEELKELFDHYNLSRADFYEKHSDRMN